MTKAIFKCFFEVFQLLRRNQHRHWREIAEATLHRRALRAVAECARADYGLGVAGAAASAVRGARGNREFFLHLTRKPIETDHAALIEEAARE